MKRGAPTSAGLQVGIEVQGRDGDDSFVGGVGNDTFEGGEGFDTVDFTGASALAVTAFAGAPASIEVVSASNGTDTLVTVDKIVGSSSGDVFDLAALDSAIDVEGRGGDDTFTGGGAGTSTGMSSSIPCTT